MGARQPVSYLLLLAAYLLIQIMFGRAVAEVPDDIRANLTRHGHALLIGVSRYDNDAWPKLLSVVDDIEDLRRALGPHFATIETLPNPTADAIRAKLREFMTGQWDQPNERLLVYYAGHGFTDYNIASRLYTGYITGKDTPACRGSDCGSALGKAIPFSFFDVLNRETKVLQVITLFDSCFSGLAIVRGPEDGATHYTADRAREEMQKPIRYYITAGGPNEKVPADSAFATLVIAGLKSEADTHKEGFFSAEELGNYLQLAVPVHARQNLIPNEVALPTKQAA